VTLGAPGFETVEPRCKVCRSPHRREIDAMLVTGWTQADVRRHWNEYLHGAAPAFTENNLSVHASRHLNPGDAALWPVRQRCVQLLLEQASPGDELALPLSENIARLLELLVSFGVYSTNTGLVEVEVTDTMRAIRARGELREKTTAGELAASRQDYDQVMREFGLFMRAVKSFLPETQWADLLERFEKLLNETPDPI
jgi:hypothetical protein